MPVKLPIYLDYNATTPVDPRVMEKMLPWFTEKFGNPHSTLHAYGWEAEDAVEQARQQIADAIHARPKEIIFTSGATESNNLAIKGVARAYRARRPHIITVATEHSCVLESAKALEAEGFEVTVLPVEPSGLLDLDRLATAMTERTLLVSVMAVNNEIGVIQPIGEIGAMCRERGILFHTDAAQALGRISLDVDRDHIDLMSLSSHKCYGPKGIGVLYIRRRPRVSVEPLFSGGGQERGIRPGTLPTPLVIGFGEAARIAEAERIPNQLRIAGLSDRFLSKIEASLEDIYLNGDRECRIAGNVNLSFGRVESQLLLAGLRDLAISSGSACLSAKQAPSHVLQALGRNEKLVKTGLRFGLGRFTTQEEIDYAAELVINTVLRLRQGEGAAASNA